MDSLDDFSGAPPAAKALSEALSSGRLHHAYLFLGNDRLAVEHFAEDLAATLLCKQRPAPLKHCGQCAGCSKFIAGTHPDLQRLTPDEKNNISVGAIRSLSQRLAFTPHEAPIKVARIEYAERMNSAAQNALLKTLEEPPGATCFILTSRHRRSLLPTIRSRCQIWGIPGATRGTDTTLLGRLFGSDSVQIAAWQERGAVEMSDILIQCVRGSVAPCDILTHASDFGSDKDRSEMALAMMELLVRDGLAEQPQDKRLARAAMSLWKIRKLQSFNINRTMALETLFFTLSQAPTL